MERFEIEDIIAQDSHGVVFRAYVRSSGTPVAIRRFFPFGKEGEGLEKDEAIAFGIAASRLASLHHPALRRVIEGAVDTIDGMPYLVSEWIEGETLPNTLNGEKLDPALVVEVMRLALEVSLVLSEVLGEELLWVETHPESILVGDAESGRGFTFWLSTSTWIGSDTEQRNLSGLVKLGEELAGWDKKLVSEQAGNGLGGWFKWLKANPETGIRQAMESLAICIGQETPPPAEIPVSKPITKSTVVIQQPSSKVPILLTGAIAVLLLVIALFYMHRNAQAPTMKDSIAKQTISSIFIEQQGQPNPEIHHTSSPAEDQHVAEARKNKAQTPTITPDPEPTQDKEVVRMQSEGTPAGCNPLSPDDREKIEGLDRGTEVTLTGLFRSTSFSGTGKSLYLEFASQASDSVRGVIHKSDYPDIFTSEDFEELIGKKVAISGTVFKDNFGNPALVKIRSRNAIADAP